LQALPLQLYLAAGTQSLVTFVLGAGALLVPLWSASALWAVGAGGAAALLGAVASTSSAHFGILGVRSGRLERRAGLAITLVAMLDDLVGLFALIVALVLGATHDVGSGLALVALAALLGMLCGLLLAFLTRGVAEEAELIALLFGAVLVVAGTAAYLRLSTLVLGVACGATLSLVGGTTVQRLYQVLARAERPVYLLLLFLAGPLLMMSDPLVWAILPAFVALRFLGKVGGTELARQVSRGLGLPRRAGWALVSQGGLSVCIVLEYLLLVPRPSSQLLFDVALLATLANEVLAGRAFVGGFLPPPELPVQEPGLPQGPAPEERPVQEQPAPEQSRREA
jgi:hypothetical protein